MNSEAVKNLALILEVPEALLLSLDKKMRAALRAEGVLEAVLEENQKAAQAALRKINLATGDAAHIRGVLRQTIVSHEKQLVELLGQAPGRNEFEKMAALARSMAKTGRGRFLKKELIQHIFSAFPPKNLMNYLGYNNILDLIEKENLVECMSAIRFIESEEWMHRLFNAVYSGFKPDDFEERDIEVSVLGPKWREVGQKFVKKKHHNVSHLKEFGVIFLNPISENIPGKLLRDFALLLHYFHEIRFYSRLFQSYFDSQDFSERFKSFLRGDVPEIKKTEAGEWLIVQRYLAKENPADPRLYLPRVNPESMHWVRGERDFALYVESTGYPDLGLWGGLDWVGGLFENGGKKSLVSFDLEDNAMSLASFMEGQQEFFIYHQREALWTEIFMSYVGGESEMEEMLIQNFNQGIIRF